MNRTRCPWCGKLIDSQKDKRVGVLTNPSVPRHLKSAKCSHCGHNYGQTVYSRFMIISAVLMALLFVIGIALKLVFIVLLAVPLAPLSLLAPYKKLDEDCKVPEYNSDLDCEFTIVEKYSIIRMDKDICELYDTDMNLVAKIKFNKTN